MTENYLVIKFAIQQIDLFQIAAKSAKEAIEKLNEHKKPRKRYKLKFLYGEGQIALPYRIANIFLRYFGLAFGNCEVEVN